ncbi:unnamed protein product, partial [Rotaria sp. Silwood1]
MLFAGSDFRFESNISKKYRDDEPPNGFGQYLFAAVIMNHPSIEYFRHTGITYRGMNLSSIELSQYVPDARILTRSFLSTSKCIDTAFLYLQFDNPSLRPVLCVYRINQSYASLAISELSAIQGEDEVLIVPFVAFRVVKVDFDSFVMSDKRKVCVVFLDEVTIDDKRLFTLEDQEWLDQNSDIFDLFCNQVTVSSLKSCNNEIVDINELENIQKSILIVGDPGSGKTTMLRWFLWTNANKFNSVLSETYSNTKVRLPILINLNDLVDLNLSASIFDFLCQSTAHGDNRQAKFIADYVNFGHTLILLDGFDQINDLQKRKQILMFVHQFVMMNSKENQLIMTSCTLQPILDELFIYYNLELFSFDKVCYFIDNWWNNHCTKIRNIQNENGNDRWKRQAHELKVLLTQDDGLKQLSSNPLLLSTMCQLATLKMIVGATPRKRIFYYHISVLVMLARVQSMFTTDDSTTNNVLIDLLSDIAAHLQQYLSTGLIEKFDMRYKFWASLKTHYASSSTNKKDKNFVDYFLNKISYGIGVFVPRDENTYGFLYSSFQDYFTCLSLIQSLEEKDEEFSKNQFLYYITNPTFREPLLLGLEWISWQWNSKDLDYFCCLLASGDDNRFNKHLPLGAMLLITTLPNLENYPSEKTLCEAFDQFISVSTDREWLVRFPVFVHHFIEGLNNMPSKIVLNWLITYFEYHTDIEKIRSVLNVLFKFLWSTRQIPLWMIDSNGEKNICQTLQKFTRVDYDRNDEGNGLFIVDRLLTMFSILNANLFVQGFIIQPHIDIQSLSPIVLVVFIALYGGLYRFKQNDSDNKDTVVFSPIHMHRICSQSSWLIDYLNANNWTHLPNSQEIEQKIMKNSPNDCSSETIDLFIIWLCLTGVKQSWIFEKYATWPALIRAILRFRRIALYLSEYYYVKYDVNRELEESSTFREDAVDIICHYSNMYNNQERNDDMFICFLDSITIALSRLMITGGARSLFVTNGHYVPRMLEFVLPKLPAMLDLNKCSDSKLATFIHRLWSPFLPEEVELLIEEYDEDTILQVVNGKHPVLYYGHLTSFLLSLIPKYFQLLYHQLLNSAPHSLPFICLLGEIVCTLCRQKKGGIRYGLLLTILRVHFEEHQWKNCFLGLLCLVTNDRTVRTYFQKFDYYLSDHNQLLSFDVQLNDEIMKRNILHTELLKERQRAEEARHVGEDDITLYNISISFAILCAALHEGENQPDEIVQEIMQTILLIIDPILRLHALAIILQLSQYYRISKNNLDWISKEALNVLSKESQISLNSHALLFLIWWTTFACHADIRMIYYYTNRLIDYLFKNINTDSTDIQQTVCQSLLQALDHEIYPYVRPRISQFIRQSQWSDSSNLAEILQMYSSAFNPLIGIDSNRIFQKESTSTLLASMYLMQLSIDLLYLPGWFNVETSINEEQTSSNLTRLEQYAIDQLNISSAHRVISEEAAIAINCLLQASRTATNDYHSLERILSQCEFVEKSAQQYVNEWLQYKDHQYLHHFAFHAALLITKYSIIAIRLCGELLDNEIDEFRQRAEKSLSTLCFLSSTFNRENFVKLFSTLLHAQRNQSILARETISKIDVRIDTIEHLNMLLNWEQQRVYYKTVSSENSFLLTDDLELQRSDLDLSLLKYVYLQSSLIEIRTYFFEYAYDRCNQIQTKNSLDDVHEQIYLAELVSFAYHYWSIFVETEISNSEKNFIFSLIQLLTKVSICPILAKAIVRALIVNRSTYPFIPLFTLNEAQRCLKNILTKVIENPISVHFSDEILAIIIKHYYHGKSTNEDDDQLLLIELQQLTSKIVVTEAADRAILRCRCLQKVKPLLQELIDLFHGQHIRLYRALMSIVVDFRTTITICSIASDLICSYQQDLLPLFARELCNINLWIECSNHLMIGVNLVHKIPIQLRTAIPDKELFNQTILLINKHNKDQREFSIRIITGLYGELTENVQDMFLSAMWDNNQIQNTAYECIKNIQRVNNRNIVENLYEQLISSRSFQRRYISGMLLVQLAKCDQISTREIQRKLAEVINQLEVMNGTVKHKGEQ